MESSVSDHGSLPSNNVSPSPRPSTPAAPAPAGDLEYLRSEVGRLATRLIEVADSKTDLEDQVQVLRKELDVARRNNMMLEDQLAQEYVKKDIYLEEVKLREAAQKDAQGLHDEIEDLTGSLFGEANNLVADANKEKAHLQMQLEERDVLLDNYKSQVAELKEIIQKQKDEEEFDEVNLNSNRLSMMSTPPPPPIDRDGEGLGSAISLGSSVNGGFSGLASGSNIALSSTLVSTTGSGVIASEESESPALTQSPDISNDATHWSLNDKAVLNSQIRPLIRKDTPVFEDFKSFIFHTTANPILIANTNTSSTYFHTPGGFPGSFPANTRPISSPNLPNNSSSPRSGTPDSPRNTLTQTTSTSNIHISSAPLTSFKLYKRCLSEDIEPTLRLDIAPGISWLAKKGVMTSIMDGTAVVEPISGVNEGAIRSHNSGMYNSNRPVATKSPCALCGENRESSIIYLRMHNLRVGKTTIQGHSTTTTTTTSTTGVTSTTTTTNSTISEKLNGIVSSGYPLCHYCLNRVRTVCDFTSFLRSVRDRVWKVDEEEGVSRAWDEFARLRERMLWARGGGIFPPPMIFGPSLRGARTATPGRDGKEEEEKGEKGEKGEEEEKGEKGEKGGEVDKEGEGKEVDRAENEQADDNEGEEITNETPVDITAPSDSTSSQSTPEDDEVYTSA